MSVIPQCARKIHTIVGDKFLNRCMVRLLILHTGILNCTPHLESSKQDNQNHTRDKQLTTDVKSEPVQEYTFVFI